MDKADNTSNANAGSANPLKAYFIGAWEEFNKITWPTKEQTATLTVITICVCIATIVFLGVFDMSVSQAYQALLSKLNS